MVVRRERVSLQQFVELFEVGAVEGDDGFRFQDALILVQLVAGRQRPKEAGQPLDVAALLQHLAHARHLLLREAERRQAAVSGCRAERRRRAANRRVVVIVVVGRR